METRVAVLAVIVREADSVAALNALLHQYESAVLGRMGVPCRERGDTLNQRGPGRSGGCDFRPVRENRPSARRNGEDRLRPRERLSPAKKHIMGGNNG